MKQDSTEYKCMVIMSDCLNRIDDLLEYRYRSMDIDELRNYILKQIARSTDLLKTLDKPQ